MSYIKKVVTDDVHQYSYGLWASTRVSSSFAYLRHSSLSHDTHAITWALFRISRLVGGPTLEGIPLVSFLVPYGFTHL